MKINKGFLLLYLLVAFPCLTIAQERAILDWSFFKNDRPANTEHQAFTWSILGYRYKVLKVDGDQVKMEFTVTNKPDTGKSYFDSKLVKSNNVRLLKHEQGHADICFIYAMKLKNLFETTNFSKKNYQADIKDIWKKIYAEMTAEQLRYDTETNHSKDFENQKKWDLYFEKAVSLY